MKHHCRLFCLLAIMTIVLFNSSFAKTPFGENTEVKIANSGSLLKEIHDVETAKAADVVVRNGFPVSGTISVGNSTLRLRSWPWGDVTSTHPNGTKVKVIGESGEFYLVEVNGQQGYMHKNYVSAGNAPASQKTPIYPGDTFNGGALSLASGVKASKNAAAGKTTRVASSTTSPNPSTSSAAKPTAKPATKVSTGSNGKIVINVPQKCQYKVKCPAPGSACGPTSLAMILGHYTGKNVDALATDLWRVCGTTASSGTGHAGLKAGAKKYGYPNAKWHFCVTQSWVRTQLKAGKPILAHVKGHYVVIKGIDNSGRIYFNDPGRSAVDRSMSFSEFSAWWRGAGSTHPCMVLK